MSDQLPKMCLVRQRFPAFPPLDIAQSLKRQLVEMRKYIQPGARVALGVGSRGITNLRVVVEGVIRELQAMRAMPFILPAMGSHGGATAEGQASLLAEYGITESSLGVPVRSSMEVEQVGTTQEGVAVYCSVEAIRADAVILINRIKPHTDFNGTIGSGILKMSVIGLGKQVGAAQYHIAASRFGYEETLRSIASIMLRTVPIVCGIAIIENQFHETSQIALLPRDQIECLETELFQEARRLMPKLPFDDIDFLIIDRLGKNISGAGMDPNIIGRGVHGYSSFLGQKDLPPPRIKRIFVRDLTPETHGNAIGIGFADLTTTRVVNGMDRQATYINALTSLTPNGAKTPIHFETDYQALVLGLKSVGLADTSQARVLRIADTLSLQKLEISEAFLSQMTGRDDLERRSDPAPMRFDPHGNLEPLGA